MADLKQYIDIMTDSLEKKKATLEEILEANRQQEQVIRDEEDISRFDELVREKSRLITRLESLDYGFQRVYDRIKDDLFTDKARYKSEIGNLQALIRTITELSITIQTTEQRNKSLVDNYFSYTRKKIRNAKKSVRVASDYYKTMSNNTVNPSVLMDKKQ